jgi:cyclohexyl-isocyanide hydratase
MTFHVAMLLFPRATQLDFTGPSEVFARMPDARASVVWKDTAPVVTDRGLALLPDATLDEVDACDRVFVPGGPGQVEMMADAAVLDWLRRMAAGARWVTSVCTGSRRTAPRGLVASLRDEMAGFLARRRAATEAAAGNLSGEASA